MTYVHPTRPHGAVKTVLPHAVAADPHDPPDRVRTAWVNRVPLAFADARTNGGLGHRYGWMLLILEGYCRARAYCWVGNAELARAYGCDPGTLKRLLRQMEADGLIQRVMTAAGRPGRLGIVLLRRANPDLPVADRTRLPDIIALMTGSRGSEAPPSGGRKRAASRGALPTPGIKTLVLKDDESTLTFARAPERGGDPDPEAEPAAATAASGRPCRPVAPPEAREFPDAGSARVHGATGLPGPQYPPPDGAEETATAEQVEAEIAELEARIASLAPRPPVAMDRIRLTNLRALRDGVWKADPLATAPPVPLPAATPRLGSWPAAVGTPASPPVETSDLIRRVARPGSGPDAVEAAARRVADRLGDDHSLGFYRRAFARVQSGELPLGVALSAWKQARGGTARCPGSVFVATLKGEGRR